MDLSWKRSILPLILVSFAGLNLCFGHEGNSGSCSSTVRESSHHHHNHHDAGNYRCNHGHFHDHGHDHGDQHGLAESKLPEELAEEEDLKLYGFGPSHHRHHDHDLGGLSEFSTLALWIHAMGCSLLVSMASLICLIILPVLFFQGKPSKIIVDSLAAFGAGAMLGDAFLHQLPHAFGGKHSHSHDHGEHSRDDFHHHEHVQSHSHSLEDLSIGLSVLSGIVIFLLVEKVVRYVEDHSGKEKSAWGHAHHHHSHKRSGKVKIDDDGAHDNVSSLSPDAKGGNKLEVSNEKEVLDGGSEGCLNDKEPTEKQSLLRKRVTTNGAGDEDKPNLDAANGATGKMTRLSESGPDPSSSNLVFGYLNLFSDGVHNFTDGMALGSAFMLHGSVGGWSRTLFLLAHELPQEVGDFGILVRSGFSVSKALFFNFLSALVALAGTAMALLLGQDPGQSSLIEGFTAGGFIYIAVAGVLPEMNNGNSTFRNSAIQVMSLILGMAVALCISLVE